MSEERKKNIIDNIIVERRRLEKNLVKLSPEEMVEPGLDGTDWSVKDVLAHLVDWEQRFLSWYEAGLRGEVPETPAPGLNWRQLRILNEQGFQKHRNRTLDDVMAEFQDSYKEVLQKVKEISVKDIFTLGHYEWMGKNENIGGYIKANTSNHYRWAKTKIRRWMREQNKL